MSNADRHVVILAEAAGGVMRHVIDLYRGLRGRGFRVSLILSPFRIDERYKPELALLPAEDIHYLPMRRGPHASDLVALLKLRRILKKFGTRIILHAHSTKAGILGSTLRASVSATVYTPHAYRGMDPKLKGAARKSVEWVEAIYGRRYDHVVAEVPIEFEYAKRIGLSTQALRLIPNGISVDHIDFQATLERRSRAILKPTIGFVGRLVYQKNPLLLIDTLHELSQQGCDARVILLGEGPLRSAMVERAQQFGLAERISWHGEAPAGEFYSKMDVMVHTSLYEALPYSLIEACAALLPIAATTNPGSEAILRGLLPGSIATGNTPKELASVVLRILNNDSLRTDEMKIQKQIASGYSTEKMISSYEELYHSLLP